MWHKRIFASLAARAPPEWGSSGKLVQKNVERRQAGEASPRPVFEVGVQTLVCRWRKVLSRRCLLHESNARSVRVQRRREADRFGIMERSATPQTKVWTPAANTERGDVLAQFVAPGKRRAEVAGFCLI